MNILNIKTEDDFVKALCAFRDYVFYNVLGNFFYNKKRWSSHITIKIYY
jgi:hypothetical protein